MRNSHLTTSARVGYNAADTHSPQKATYQVDTAAGDVKHLYGQGRPMAWQASGAGANYAYGKASQDGTATANMESWLMFDGTMVDSGAANDLSRITDAREKGRIGIFGNALSYAGSYGRVTSESIGRDLNPLGRGDGRAYVAGALNLGRIAPRLPRGMAGVGTGNSVNNCNQKDPAPVAKDPQGSGSRCVDCCDPWNVDCGRTSGTNPNWENPCADVCDYENAPAGTDCRKRECDCRKCTWEMWNSLGCSQPTRHEALCENCCCEGCPCSVNGRGGSPPVGTTGNSGNPVFTSPGILNTIASDSSDEIERTLPGIVLFGSTILPALLLAPPFSNNPYTNCVWLCYWYYGAWPQALRTCLNLCNKIAPPPKPKYSSICDGILAITGCGTDLDCCYEACKLCSGEFRTLVSMLIEPPVTIMLEECCIQQCDSLYGLSPSSSAADRKDGCKEGCQWCYGSNTLGKCV